MQAVYYYFACRSYVQGVYASKGPNIRKVRPMDAAFRMAHERLSTIAREHGILDFPTLTQLKNIHSLIYFKIGTQDEEILSKSFQSILTEFGEVLAGDEKLFRFTGKSGIVRKVPNKPAKIGIWHYQMVVYLECGLTFVIYTRAHVTTSLMGTSTQTCMIVKDWADIAMSRESPSTIVMDSYYLSKACRKRVP